MPQFLYAPPLWLLSLSGLTLERGKAFFLMVQSKLLLFKDKNQTLLKDSNYYTSSMHVIVCEAMCTSTANAKSACQFLSHVIILFQSLCATAYTRKAILLQVLAMSNLHVIMLKCYSDGSAYHIYVVRSRTYSRDWGNFWVGTPFLKWKASLSPVCPLFRSSLLMSHVLAPPQKDKRYS